MKSPINEKMKYPVNNIRIVITLLLFLVHPEVSEIAVSSIVSSSS